MFSLVPCHVPAPIPPKNGSRVSSTSSNRSIAPRFGLYAKPYGSASRRRMNSPTTTIISSSSVSDPASVPPTALFLSPQPQTESAYVLSTVPVCPIREESFPAQASRRVSFVCHRRRCLNSRKFMLFCASRPRRHVCLFRAAAAASLSSDRFRRSSVHVVSRRRPNHALQTCG